MLAHYGCRINPGQHERNHPQFLGRTSGGGEPANADSAEHRATDRQLRGHGPRGRGERRGERGHRPCVALLLAAERWPVGELELRGAAGLAVGNRTVRLRNFQPGGRHLPASGYVRACRWRDIVSGRDQRPGDEGPGETPPGSRWVPVLPERWDEADPAQSAPDCGDEPEVGRSRGRRPVSRGPLPPVNPVPCRRPPVARPD